MAKVTRRTSVPSNGRIPFLPRIYEFYIGAWFCLGKGEGSRPRQPPPQHGMQGCFASDFEIVCGAADGARLAFQKDVAENAKSQKKKKKKLPRIVSTSRTIQRKVKALGLEDNIPIHRRPNPF